MISIVYNQVHGILVSRFEEGTHEMKQTNLTTTLFIFVSFVVIDFMSGDDFNQEKLRIEVKENLDRQLSSMCYAY